MPLPLVFVTEPKNSCPFNIVIRPFAFGCYQDRHRITLPATNGSKTIAAYKFCDPHLGPTELHIFTDEGGEYGDSMQMLLPVHFVKYPRIHFKSVDGLLVIEGIRGKDSDNCLLRRHGCGFLGRRNYHYNVRVPVPIGIRRVICQPETVIAHRNEQGAAIAEHQPLPAKLVPHQLEMVTVPRIVLEALTKLPQLQAEPAQGVGGILQTDEHSSEGSMASP